MPVAVRQPAEADTVDFFVILDNTTHSLHRVKAGPTGG